LKFVLCMFMILIVSLDFLLFPKLSQVATERGITRQFTAAVFRQVTLVARVFFLLLVCPLESQCYIIRVFDPLSVAVGA